jgi:hypothetical protein
MREKREPLRFTRWLPPVSSARCLGTILLRPRSQVAAFFAGRIGKRTAIRIAGAVDGQNDVGHGMAHSRRSTASGYHVLVHGAVALRTANSASAAPIVDEQR